MTGDPIQPDGVCEGGDLDCGSGLLLMIREALIPIPRGGILEIRSRETSVREDLPAWCRMVGHTIVSTTNTGDHSTSFFVQKSSEDKELLKDLKKAREFEWRVRVAWKEGLAANAYARNHSIPVGQPASFDTTDAAPSAIELLLSSLGGCLAVGFAWRASKQSIKLHGLEVSLSAQCDNILVFLGIEEAGSPALSVVKITAYVSAEGDTAALESLWTETVRRSPVAQSLIRGARLQITLKRS